MLCRDGKQSQDVIGGEAARNHRNAAHDFQHVHETRARPKQLRGGTRPPATKGHPNSEHVIDWFHITMRLTVLQQQTKTLEEQRPESGAATSKQLTSIKRLLWHGNVEEALERLANLLMDLELILDRSALTEKLAAGIAEFQTYIRNNQESIPNYGERYGQRETISTAFVESTINQVVSRASSNGSKCTGRYVARSCFCRPGQKS
jgi:hypothetical protein